MFLYILPFVGAILWGIFYALAGESLKYISVATWCLLFGVASVIAALILHYTTDQTINLAPLSDKRILIITAACVVTAKLADMTITYAMTNSPATFVAFGEALYPLFVPIFAYFFFGNKELTPQSLAGGVIMVIGMYIFVSSHNVTKEDTAFAQTETIQVTEVHESEKEPEIILAAAE